MSRAECLQIEAWLARFGANRIASGTRRAEANRSRLAELRPRFARLMVQVGQSVQHEWISRPECGVLKKITDHCNRLIASLHAELLIAETTSQAAAHAHDVQELLTLVEGLISQTRNQLQMIDELRDEGRAFASLLDCLLTTPSTGTPLVRRLLGQIGQTVATRVELVDMLPDPAIQVAGLLGPFARPHDAEIIASGLVATRLFSAVLREKPSAARRAELLPAAALLHDVGLTAIDQFERSEFHGDTTAIRQRHPAIGAALVSGLTGFPAQLSLLIARHHERDDGSGGPRGIRGTEWQQPQRMFAAGIRFLELLHEQPVETFESAVDFDFRAESAARQLIRETRQGAFRDEEIGALLTPLFGEFPDDWNEPTADRQPFSRQPRPNRRSVV